MTQITPKPEGDRILPAAMLAELRRVFGFSSFKPLQQEVIAAAAAGRDLIALMPTGGGKSLCYQLPALLRPGVTVVVSPLIALMKDQIDKLHALGVAADFINSSLTPNEVTRRQTALAGGSLKLLYVAPERLMTPGFIRLLGAAPLGGFAIDEAHCISEWGHDFRPEYRELSRLREFFPAVAITAFTATATARVQADIVAQLRLREAAQFRGSFDRANLFYQVFPKRDAYRRLTSYLRAHRGQSGIVYCLARAGTESLAAKLSADGFRAAAYHAGLDSSERKRRQDAFTRDETQIIVATIAFGMGIDKPNVRFVIHYDLPRNLEGYYQESGRAGRNGQPSDCILFYSYGDAVRQEYFIKQRTSERERAIGQGQLRQMVTWASGTSCRRRALLRYFGENLTADHEHCCDVCQPSDIPLDRTVAASPKPAISQGDDELFQQLRQSRRRLADERNVPAYVVFPDSTLQQMATERPQSPEQLHGIPGVGERKLADFGGEFLRVIAKFRQEHGDTVAAEAAAPVSRSQPPGPRLVNGGMSESARISLEVFRKGKDARAIEESRGLSATTVSEHLAQAILAGEILELGRLIAIEKQQAVEAVIAELGAGLLKPLKERLGDEFSYEEIRYVQALVRRSLRAE